MPVIPALWRLRQEDPELMPASVTYEEPVSKTIKEKSPLFFQC
jgi:hypothetical protein